MSRPRHKLASCKTDVLQKPPCCPGVGSRKRYLCVCVDFFYCRASGRKMEKFSVSVNIAAESNVTFILTYEELLQRKQGQYEILIRVKPKSLVEQFQVSGQMIHFHFLLPPYDSMNMVTKRRLCVGNRFRPTFMSLRACLMLMPTPLSSPTSCSP